METYIPWKFKVIDILLVGYLKGFGGGCKGSLKILVQIHIIYPAFIKHLKIFVESLMDIEGKYIKSYLNQL